MFSLLFGKIKGYILAFGVAVGIILTAYIKGRKDSKDSYEASEAKEKISSLKKAKEVSDNVKKLSNSDLDRELDRFMRD